MPFSRLISPAERGCRLLLNGRVAKTKQTFATNQTLVVANLGSSVNSMPPNLSPSPQFSRFSTATKQKKKGGAMTYIYKLTPEMQKVTGKESSTRPELLKLIWEYIKKNDLGAGKGEVKCDAILKGVFENKESVKNTEIMKLMQKHVLERIS